MHKNVQIAIAKKVKGKAKDCHLIHRTSLVSYEEQYEKFYIHCLKYFGCEITRNSGYALYYIVYQPENLDRTTEDCIASYNESLLKKPLKKSKPFVFNVSHVAFFILGMLFMVVIAMIRLYAT